MKPFISFLVLIALTYYSFYSLMPQKGSPAALAETEFSTERALVPLKEITKEPHYITSEAHEHVRNYLLDELRKLGLNPEVQEGYIVGTSWGNSPVIDKPKNIIAKIEGSGSGKALLLMSHYDSALVPSYGASDAGSGIVTILEGLRAYLATGVQPKNDIIILFTDAEEVGLDGAKLFVREHPWAKDVGLALNFEARGSGGPSNMIVETNGGNANLIKNFIEANPQYPVASSLMYSIYKLLPNDTDSTILREEADIDSFFFAFIDDHFDYHTAQDNYENLDENTLQHQGSYLMPLLAYFAEADLSKLKAQEDNVYVSFPFANMISYPFSWVLPMLILAVFIFIILIAFGIKKGALTAKEIGKGFIPFTISFVLSGLVSYFGWLLLDKLYPHYNEIQHGFTYNGRIYIAFFVVLTLGILFICYRKFKTENVVNAFVAPLFLWIIINAFIAFYLKGAAYFIIPVFFGLVSLWVLIRQENPNVFLLLLLAAPAVLILSPLIQFLPIGLGLEMLVGSAIFTVLLFGLLLPVVGSYQWKRPLAYLSFLIAIILFFQAHAQNDFSKNRKKPNSLVYYQNADARKAYWVTYDAILDEWTKGYLGENPEEASKYVESAAGSKYNTGYSYAAEAPVKMLNPFKVSVKKDTIIDSSRHVNFVIQPQRKVNLLRFYANANIVFNDFTCNGLELKLDSVRPSKALFRYYVSDQDSLNISFRLPKNEKVDFNVLEYSYDLLSHKDFTIHKRPEHMMPKPFVNTDAIVLTKKIRLGSLRNN